MFLSDVSSDKGYWDKKIDWEVGMSFVYSNVTSKGIIGIKDNKAYL